MSSLVPAVRPVPAETVAPSDSSPAQGDSFGVKATLCASKVTLFAAKVTVPRHFALDPVRCVNTPPAHG